MKSKYTQTRSCFSTSQACDDTQHWSHDVMTLTPHPLDDAHHVVLGALPGALSGDDLATFEQWWALHPDDFHEIMMHGRMVRTPRYQQAYGRDYRYTGNVNAALELTREMEEILGWCTEHVDERLNGLLFNWYDGAENHYIGAHRDSTSGLVPDSPIVTISLGEERVFRMRPWKKKGFTDFVLGHGDVLIIPSETNAAWTHEVPNFARYEDRRISITARAFED